MHRPSCCPRGNIPAIEEPSSPRYTAGPAGITGLSSSAEYSLAGLAYFNDLSENEVNMKYKVVLKKSKDGYSVSCPGLPGCWSQGKTEGEALENIQDAIREYLEAAVKISKGSKMREVEVSV